MTLNSSFELHKFSDYADSIIESNVQTPQEARVVGILVNHKNKSHQEFINKILSQNSPSPYDILLVEDPRTLDKWKFDMRKESWEDSKILEEVLPKKKALLHLKKIISGLDNPAHPIEPKLTAVRKILDLESKEQVEIENEVENLENCLKTIPFNLSQIKHIQNRFSESVDKFYDTFREKTLTETFPARQHHLISKIVNNIGFHRIFFICGASHGDVKLDFPLEAQKLVTSLKENTSFILYSLDTI